MVRRLLALVVVTLLLVLGSPAAQAGIPPGRGARTQAAMYADMTYQSGPRLQILDKVCEDLARLRECSPMSTALRRAIESAFTRRFVWVSSRPADGPEFRAFAPVRFDGDVALAEYAWWELGDFGCLGGVRITYERIGGAWRSTTGIGWAGCPAG